MTIGKLPGIGRIRRTPRVNLPVISTPTRKIIFEWGLTDTVITCILIVAWIAVYAFTQ